MVQQLKFGKQLRDECFSFKEGYLPLNHGSFGMSPDSVFERQQQIQQDVHSNSDLFYRFTLFDGYKESQKIVAQELDADVDNLAFVANATTGVNAVLRSYPFKEGDTIIYSSVIYGACRKTLQFMQNRYKLNLVEINLVFPTFSDDIVDAFVEKMESAGGSCKMCLFDTLSSMPAWKFPWEKLVEECRKRGVLSLVDGAHGYGIIPISLRSTKPDFFVTNVHKWGYISQSCAAFYVDKAHHHKIHTMPISHSYQFDEDIDPANKLHDFSYRFTFVGTLDYSSMLSIPAAKEFTDSLGGFEKIREYNRELADKACQLATKKLGTENMAGSAMFNVRVPLDLPQSEHALVTRFIQEWLLLERNCCIPLYSHGGNIWARISAQIYLDIDDIERGFDYLLEAIEHYHRTPKDEITYKSLLL